MNNPFQFQPANMNVGMAGRLQMPMQGQGRPGASNTLQQISRIVMARQQQRPPETGWRQTISPQERAVLIFQIATQLQLVKGSLSVEQAVKEALNFEASVFNGAESKEQWSNACQTKLKEIHHHRQEQAKAQMQANNAQNVQMGGMPGQNVMQSVMPAQNQFQQSGFPHPQLQQQMQPSPIPRQPQQQPQPVGGAHNISNLPNQVAPPPQFQNVMAQPSMGLQGGQKVEALTPQEVHYCQELVKQQRQLLTQPDIEKIKADIQQFDPRQTQMLRKSQMDPIDYYLRTKIVRSYQQRKNELAVERARQQLQVQQQRQSQQGGMNNTSALNDLSGMGAGPTLSRGLQPQGLAGGPQPTVSGAGNFDNFLTGVHDMVGQQQATALELQKQGHPVVPANTGTAGKQPIAGNAPQMGQAPLNQKLNPGQIRPMPNMGGPTSQQQQQQQQQQNNFLAMQSQQTNARPQAAQLNPRVQSQDETRAQAQAQQAQQAHLEAQGRAAAAQAQASNQGFLRGQPGGMTPQIGTRIAQSPAMPNLNQPLRTPVPQSQQPQQKTPQQRPQHHQAPVVMPTRQPFDAGPPQQSQQPVQPGTIAGNPPMNMSGGSTAGRLPPTLSKEWIFNMLQAGQISRDQARAYIVRLQQQPQQQPSVAPQNPANMQPMPPNSLQMGPQSLAGLPHMSQQMQQPNPHHGQPNHTMGAQNPNFFPTQPSTQQQLARAIQIQQSLITATSLTPEREREMDLKEFPPNIVNASNSLPESIRTWGQLKQWAANNPTFHMQGQLERIQLFFSQELARRQMAEYQSRLPVHLRQAFSQPGQQPGPQFQPSRMNLGGQPPGARPQPITQGQNTDSPMRKPTPEEIKAFKEKLIQKMPNITDDQVMNYVLQRMAANTQPQQRNPANIQRPIGGTEQTFSRRQPDFNPIQQGLWNESQQFQRPDPPPMQPQNSQSSASGKAGRGQMNPNPPTQDQKPAGHALPPAQPRKNLKRPSPDHVNEKLPTERSGQPSRQLPPQQPTAQKQIQKSDLEIKVEKKMYQLSVPWIKSTRQIVEREIIAMSMKPKRKIVQMNINEKGEMARVLQNLKRVQLDRLSRNLHFVYGELGQNMVRQYQQMRMVLEQQFPKQAGGDPANLNFTISLDDLRQYVSKIDGLMQLFLEKHKAFHKSCMDSVQGQSSQQPGQSQPHNVNQGIPPQQQQQAEGRSLPLNAKNLQQHQEEFKNQRQQIPHKATGRGNQAPAAPTSSKPPFGFSAASPQGVPVYASNEQPVQPKLPPAKKRKGNQGGSTASTPANNQPTPTAVTSPKLLKVNSPQANRKVGPEAAKPPAEAQSTFKCPVAACDSHNAPFKTELDLKKHIFDVHEPKEPPIRDPLKFALETVASTVGLNQDGTRKQVKEPTASQPMARTPSKLSQALKSKPSAGPLARAATQTASSYKMSPSPSQQKGTPQGAPNKPPTSSAMQAGGGSKQSKTASPDKSSDKEPTSQQSTPPSLLWADSSISPEDMRRCFEGMAGLPGLSTKEDFSSLSSAHTPSTDSKTSPGRASDIGEGDKLTINLAGSVAGDGDKAVKDLDLDVNMDMDLDGLGDGHKMDWFSMADPGAEFMGAPAGGVGLEGGIEKLDMEEDLSWWADLGESYGDATQEEDMLFGDQGVFGLML